jgi:hypothetical protein
MPYYLIAYMRFYLEEVVIKPRLHAKFSSQLANSLLNSVF